MCNGSQIRVRSAIARASRARAATPLTSVRLIHRLRHQIWLIRYILTEQKLEHDHQELIVMTYLYVNQNKNITRIRPYIYVRARGPDCTRDPRVTTARSLRPQSPTPPTVTPPTATLPTRTTIFLPTMFLPIIIPPTLVLPMLVPRRSTGIFPPGLFPVCAHLQGDEVSHSAHIRGIPV
jgi:hypothetical protein